MTQNQQVEPFVDDRQPILSIALKPRETIRYVLQHKGLRYFVFVGIIGAFSSNLASFIGTKYNAAITLGDIVYSSFISGVLLFILTTVIISALLHTLGKTLGGRGKFKEMFRAMCVTVIPYIWILPVLLFWMQLSPQSYFSMASADQILGDVLMKFVGSGLVMIMGIWTFVITLIGISEVHKFSKWKAFFAFIIAVIILAIILFALSTAAGVQLY
ncbi:Yip1 family protein [Solibacillus sp. FSL H8-0538]|uniref:Yip1 family protein n=1 Tax=Solibacillus sp. FSL H8-0538 TaxID=2921400 RepID=UPI0030F5A804